MRIERKGNVISIETPAKVNLFLDILGRRDDGFHEIASIMCPIAICDHLRLELTDEPEIDLEVAIPALGRSDKDLSTSRHRSANHRDPAWDIPSDDRNLIVRAFAGIRQELGVTQGARIRIIKRIPAAAGLGGGSSDAAAAIVAGLIALGRWDRELAVKVSASLGSDIPFFLGNSETFGLALAIGRGEQCTFMSDQPPLNFVITHPPRGCSTQAIYQEYSKNTHKLGKPRRKLTAYIDDLKSNTPQKIGVGMFNALQSSAARLNPWIKIQLEMMRHCGAKHVLMSGSGSSCFALDAGEQTERRIREMARVSGVPRVFSAGAIYSSSIEQQICHWTS